MCRPSGRIGQIAAHGRLPGRSGSRRTEREPFSNALLGLYQGTIRTRGCTRLSTGCSSRNGVRRMRSKRSTRNSLPRFAAEPWREFGGRASRSAVPEVVGPLLPAPGVAVGKDWYVNGEGQTYAVMRGPVEFTVGSALTETDRVAVNEPPHRKRIDRTFAIATKEVTVAEYLRFRPNHEWEKRYSPGPDAPVVAVSWYDYASAYCNWLERTRGDTAGPVVRTNRTRAVNTPVYGGHARVLTADGLSLADRVRVGCACRAGTVTSRYYGLRGDD